MSVKLLQALVGRRSDLKGARNSGLPCTLPGPYKSHSGLKSHKSQKKVPGPSRPRDQKKVEKRDRTCQNESKTTFFFSTFSQLLRPFSTFFSAFFDFPGTLFRLFWGISGPNGPGRLLILPCFPSEGGVVWTVFDAQMPSCYQNLKDASRKDLFFLGFT